MVLAAIYVAMDFANYDSVRTGVQCLLRVTVTSSIRRLVRKNKRLAMDPKVFAGLFQHGVVICSKYWYMGKMGICCNASDTSEFFGLFSVFMGCSPSQKQVEVIIVNLYFNIETGVTI